MTTEKNSKKPSDRPQRIALPFEKRRRGDAGDWIYRHRVGLMVTIVLYLIAGILFVSYKIVVIQNPASIMYVDLVDEQKEQPLTPEEQQKLIEQLEQYDRDPARNRMSNEHAEQNTHNTYSRSLQDDRDSRVDELYDQARRVQEELEAGQKAFERGMNEVEAMQNRHRMPQSDEQINRQNRQNQQRNPASQQDQNTRVQGNVTVRVNLFGRIVTSWYVPAYQCRGAGTVVVGVTVNKNGEVTGASVNSVTAGSEDCISERAVQAAYATVFSADAGAPDRQRGTITYTFVAQ